jgi:hypothetical protein
MSVLRAVFILILASGMTSAFAEQITCESHQDGVEACSTVLAGSHVRLVEQLSKAPCIEGQSWGLDTKLNSVWISGGCRAVFDVKPPRDDPNSKRHEVLRP